MQIELKTSQLTPNSYQGNTPTSSMRIWDVRSLLPYTLHQSNRHNEKIRPTIQLDNQKLQTTMRICINLPSFSHVFKQWTHVFPQVSKACPKIS